MISKNMFLFALCSLIWGTTWLVIKFQIDSTPPVVGVFYRFLIAALIMFLLNHFVSKKPLKYPLKNHIIFFLQGLFNFCLNYILTYYAEESISSALVALSFTVLIYFNMIGMRIWFKRKASRTVVLGGILGACGITLLFWKDILNSQWGGAEMMGIGLGILATFFASTGNMFAFRNHQLKIPVMVFNSYGMLYGAFCSLIIGLCFGNNFYFPLQKSFLISLFYLSLFGTVIAFWAYQTLVGTIGADRAAFSGIISPVIAVIVSSFFENLTFTPYIIGGMILCFLGNYISLRGVSIRRSA